MEPDSDRASVGETVFHVLRSIALWRRDRSAGPLLHASGVLDRSGRAVLFAGAVSAGKTTLFTRSVLGHGATPLTNDRAWVTERGTRVHSWLENAGPLRRAYTKDVKRIYPMSWFAEAAGTAYARMAPLGALVLARVAPAVERSSIETLDLERPGCGPCVGTQGSVPPSGSTVLTTMNRNFRGRMGNGAADIHLSSPLVAATAAVLGRFPSRAELAR
ncbi:aconitase family protein [Cellulomonas oligotrophica]|uniref:Aconitase/3-isopropylmalate dehydratase large subunit alpha/beta/alpha domain-containing protein n=1 Tax=Cellulomonas oligotrophica TaxID=931536 RepID=A0A7Y9JZL0_9CELL|nr:aconitase family protein [Cellulomonas oligotrophica]NYD87996.1 hypothetical protein [Cellulomonas oligotrophica]GIG34490.1 hypothetical protein Col01nite_36490 [Cellulomonas oligotrophica]